MKVLGSEKSPELILVNLTIVFLPANPALDPNLLGAVTPNRGLGRWVSRSGWGRCCAQLAELGPGDSKTPIVIFHFIQSPKLKSALTLMFQSKLYIERRQ